MIALNAGVADAAPIVISRNASDWSRPIVQEGQLLVDDSDDMDLAAARKADTTGTVPTTDALNSGYSTAAYWYAKPSPTAHVRSPIWRWTSLAAIR